MSLSASNLLIGTKCLPKNCKTFCFLWCRIMDYLVTFKDAEGNIGTIEIFVEDDYNEYDEAECYIPVSSVILKIEVI